MFELKPFGYTTCKGSNIILNSHLNNTDFLIGIYPSIVKKFGEFQFDPCFEIGWPKFESQYFEFHKWYADHEGGPKPQKRHEFLLISFDKIEFNKFGKSRALKYISDESDIRTIAAKVKEDYIRFLNDWISSWFDWRSAHDLMEADAHLCGVWRPTAMFCIKEKVFGRESACAWINGHDSTGYAEFVQAQIDFLREKCQN
jgi:hypothetical protein